MRTGVPRTSPLASLRSPVGFRFKVQLVCLANSPSDLHFLECVQKVSCPDVVVSRILVNLKVQEPSYDDQLIMIKW